MSNSSIYIWIDGEESTWSTLSRWANGRSVKDQLAHFSLNKN